MGTLVVAACESGCAERPNKLSWSASNLPTWLLGCGRNRTMASEAMMVLEGHGRDDKEKGNPFCIEGGSDVAAEDNTTDLQCELRTTPPAIEIKKALLPGNNSSSSNPFGDTVDAEERYGDCYKDLDNTVGQTDDGAAGQISGEADSIKMENRDDK